MSSALAETGWLSLTFINGEQSDSLPVTDRATQYGDGLFETMRWDGGKLLMLEAHLSRLQRGCQRLRLPLNLNLLNQQIDQFTHALLQQDCQSAVVKLMVSRGSGGRGYLPPERPDPRIILQSHPLPDNLANMSQVGIAALQSSIPVTENPLLAGLKHLNRLDSVLASQELALFRNQHPNYPQLNETLLRDSRGNFIEGSRSNIFAVLDGKLITPELTRSGVAGVVRDALLASSRQAGINCSIETLSLEKVSSASELFVCNSIIGIQPVHTLYLQSEAYSDVIVEENACDSVSVVTQQTDQLTFTDRSVTAHCQALIAQVLNGQVLNGEQGENSC